MSWRWVDKDSGTGWRGSADDVRVGAIEAARVVTQQATPMHEPTEAALDGPAALKHGKAILVRRPPDDAAAPA